MAELIIRGVLTPGVESVAPPVESFKSFSGRVANGGDDPLDLTYAGGSEEGDLTETDRAMAAQFSDGHRSHREKGSYS